MHSRQLDYAKAGQIRDDDVFSTLIAPMPKGVIMTSVFDCCHSGTVLDLPYVFLADGESDEMVAQPDFDFTKLQGLLQNFMALQQSGNATPEQQVQAVSQLCDALGCNIL